MKGEWYMNSAGNDGNLRSSFSGTVAIAISSFFYIRLSFCNSFHDTKRPEIKYQRCVIMFSWYV